MSSISGFYFRERAERVNWRKIASIDLNSLIVNVNVSILHDVLGNLTFSHLEVGEVPDRLVIKFAKLTQLALEFLLYQRALDDIDLEEISSASDNSEKRILSLERTVREQKQREKLLKANVQQLKDTLHYCSQYLMVHGHFPNGLGDIKNHVLSDFLWNVRSSQCRGYPHDTIAHICPICSKAFSSETYLLRHRQKRHPNSFTNTTSLEDPPNLKALHGVNEKEYNESCRKLREDTENHLRNVAAEEANRLRDLSFHLQKQEAKNNKQDQIRIPTSLPNSCTVMEHEHWKEQLESFKQIQQQLNEKLNGLAKEKETQNQVILEKETQLQKLQKELEQRYQDKIIYDKNEERWIKEKEEILTLGQKRLDQVNLLLQDKEKQLETLQELYNQLQSKFQENEEKLAKECLLNEQLQQHLHEKENELLAAQEWNNQLQRKNSTLSLDPLISLVVMDKFTQIPDDDNNFLKQFCTQAVQTEVVVEKENHIIEPPSIIISDPPNIMEPSTNLDYDQEDQINEIMKKIDQRHEENYYALYGMNNKDRSELGQYIVFQRHPFLKTIWEHSKSDIRKKVQNIRKTLETSLQSTFGISPQTQFISKQQLAHLNKNILSSLEFANEVILRKMVHVDSEATELVLTRCVVENTARKEVLQNVQQRLQKSVDRNLLVRLAASNLKGVLATSLSPFTSPPTGLVN